MKTPVARQRRKGRAQSDLSSRMVQHNARSYVQDLASAGTPERPSIAVEIVRVTVMATKSLIMQTS